MKKLKAKDLRIGNYVELESGIEIQIIAGNLIYIENGELAVYSVELTEEWMLKFGFTYTKPGIQGADMWQWLGFWRIIKNESIVLRGNNPMLGLILGGYFNTHILYVHQLQNLYFALTGEELTIKS